MNTCAICKQAFATVGELERHACQGLVTAPWSRPRGFRLTPGLAYGISLLLTMAMATPAIVFWSHLDPWGMPVAIVLCAVLIFLLWRKVPADDPLPEWMQMWPRSGPVYWFQILLLGAGVALWVAIAVVALLR